MHVLYQVVVFRRGKFYYKVGRTKNTPAKRYSRGRTVLIHVYGWTRIEDKNIRRAERLLKHLTKKRMGRKPDSGNEFWELEMPHFTF